MTDFILKKYPCLSDKNFVRFFCSQFISQTGGYIQNVALSMLINEGGGKALRLGIFLCVCYLPVCVLSIPASKLISRLGPKRVLLVTEALLFALSVVLTLFYKMPYLLLCAFGGVWGAVRAFQTPAASAAPPPISGGDRLGSAVSLGTLALSLARGAGPAAAGALYSFFGVRAAFLVNALTYIPSFWLIARTKIPFESKKKKTSAKPNISKVFVFCVFAVALCATSYNVIFSSICRHLSLPKTHLALFMAFLGVGAAVGSFFGFKRLGRMSGLLLGASILCLSFAKSTFWVCVFAAGYGLFDFLFFSTAQTKISRENGGGALARAMGIYTSILNGGMLSGYLFSSTVCLYFGVNTLLTVCALVIAAASVFFFDKIR